MNQTGFISNLDTCQKYVLNEIEIACNNGLYENMDYMLKIKTEISRLIDTVKSGS